MKRLLVVALSVSALCLAPAVGVQAQGKAKSMTASGTVKAVSGSSLTVTAAGGKDMTFTVDNSTKFVGKGLGTKAKAGNLTATDAVPMRPVVDTVWPITIARAPIFDRISVTWGANASGSCARPRYHNGPSTRAARLASGAVRVLSRSDVSSRRT